MVVGFEEIYRSAFPGETALEAFVACVERSFVDPERTPAKIILHQAGRMVRVGDELRGIEPGSHAFQVMFLTIAAEAVAKLYFDFREEGESRKYAQRFFGEICEERDRERLNRAFWALRSGRYLSSDEAVNFLYDVRCDLAHEAKYDTFYLEVQPGVQHFIPGWRGGEPLRVEITLDEIRRIVLKGAVVACRKRLPPETDCLY